MILCSLQEQLDGDMKYASFGIQEFIDIPLMEKLVAHEPPHRRDQKIEVKAIDKAFDVENEDNWTITLKILIYKFCHLVGWPTSPILSNWKCW